MRPFRLVAAPDGQLIHEVIRHPDMGAATVWAAGLLVRSFSLDVDNHNLMATIAPEMNGLH